jgi:hypothetical protein
MHSELAHIRCVPLLHVGRSSVGRCRDAGVPIFRGLIENVARDSNHDVDSSKVRAQTATHSST